MARLISPLGTLVNDSHLGVVDLCCVELRGVQMSYDSRDEAILLDVALSQTRHGPQNCRRIYYALRLVRPASLLPHHPGEGIKSLKPALLWNHGTMCPLLNAAVSNSPGMSLLGLHHLGSTLPWNSANPEDQAWGGSPSFVDDV